MSISKKLMTTGATDVAYVDDVFSTYVYTGDGSARDIVNGIDLDGEGGLTWIKSRSDSAWHNLFDTERGASRRLVSNDTGEERYDADTQKTHTSFNSDGFSLGIDNQNFGVNNTGKDYASWTFRKAPSFFDVVTWTGDGVKGREIPHNLGVEPGMVIIKVTSNAQDWIVYHRGLSDPAKEYLVLNQPGALNGNTGIFNSTAPTSSVFTVGSTASVNANGYEYVAYVFAHDDSDEGLIQCGSYTGNGNADGPEIDLGWEPQWLLVKSATASGQPWGIYDVMRGMPTGGDTAYLSPDRSNEEYANQGWIDVTPRGFKLVNLNGDNFVNGSGDQYIYMAIRRPNKPAEEFEADELFWIDVSSGSDTPNFQTRAQNSGDPAFPIDFALNRSSIASTSDTHVATRMHGEKEVWTNSHSVEGSQRNHTFDFMDGFADRNLPSWYAWMWRRAPGFFDVVAYGGPVSNYISHNLTVPPEMIWTKERSGNAYWDVWHKDLLGAATINGYSPSLVLNTDAAVSAAQGYSDTPPTENQYYLSSIGGALNEPNKTYVAYLFASVPGICDIGSYTGTGGTQYIDCGFTNSSRFVLIKRTDAAGDWMYWDTLRGIVSGMSPYLTLNTTNRQVEAFRVYPYAEGFQISDDHSVNANGGTYIYMAIA